MRVRSPPKLPSFNALVAQWLEQGSHKPLVAGSSPAERTKRNSNIIIEENVRSNTSNDSNSHIYISSNDGREGAIRNPDIIRYESD